MVLTDTTAHSSDPLRPILGQRLKHVGGGSVRKAISFQGSINRRANLQLAESLLTISQSEFRTKWNFDPIAETPLPQQGQFLWTPLTPMSQVPLVDVKLATAMRPKTEAEADLATCFRLPHKENVTKINDKDPMCKESENKDVKNKDQICKEQTCLSVTETSTNKLLCPDMENNNNSINLFKTNAETDTKTSKLRASTNKRQPVITDFLRASKKRTLSSSSESVSGTTPGPPSKLRRIRSDGDTS
ncbi:unnamed protein product [Meganyctiphanes norvegica]|uniref:Cyclin-dependent kinase inhibitor domain-containing protein n=1 Tax=Meganyctiphanes norvegica TaxID=48144 RepID=A0AAV2S885_MEGNR